MNFNASNYHNLLKDTFNPHAGTLPTASAPPQFSDILGVYITLAIDYLQPNLKNTTFCYYDRNTFSYSSAQTYCNGQKSAFMPALEELNVTYPQGVNATFNFTWPHKQNDLPGCRDPNTPARSNESPQSQMNLLLQLIYSDGRQPIDEYDNTQRMLNLEKGYPLDSLSPVKSMNEQNKDIANEPARGITRNILVIFFLLAISVPNHCFQKIIIFSTVSLKLMMVYLSHSLF